ncbi:MAG: DUF3108 domain-containing protein [Pseudomonadota bacterium]
MHGGLRSAALALVISLLLHVILLGGVRWSLPQGTDDADTEVFEARLIPADPAPPAKPAAAPTQRIKPAPVPRVEPPPLPAAVDESIPSEAVSEPPLPVPDSVAGFAVPAPEPASPPPPREAAPVAEPVAEPPVPSLNELPGRIDMRFDVLYGIASGEQTLIWVNEGARYTLTSVASATGLAGVFYRGRFVQTSRGRITPQGLQPEEFWDQRGDRRASARLDAGGGQVALTTSSGETRHFAYRPGMQDALSLFFQLALAAPPPQGQLQFAVFNGKKVRRYAFETRGEEILDTALGPLRTLHLMRLAKPEERFEAWLAVDRHYLPVRVLRSDGKGNTMELRVRTIAP